MNPLLIDSQTPVLLAAAAVCLAVYSNTIRRRHKIHRAGILPADVSPWRHLLNNGDEASFLNLTGFSKEAFERLHIALYPNHLVRQQNMGRPSLLSTRDKLGLLLFYCGSTMNLHELCIIFGITPTRCSDILNKVLLLAYNRLKNNLIARIHWPSSRAEKEFYADLVRIREPRVVDVIAFVDGVSLPIKCAADPVSQATNYNGYHHDTMCNNVFCFAPTGKIIYACINYPGSWHDSQVSQQLSARVVNNIGNYKICVDQGFPRSGDLYNKFVGPISERARRNLPIEGRQEILRRHNIYVSLRQSSEWGMRALQGSFTRLKSRLHNNKQKRKIIITTICLLHNFRTHLVGLNQIATVFNPEYDAFINVNNYDRIARIML
jgi:hypothetical protein